ncbi:MAG: phage virion morphogenesis protein [Rhodospirillales bacterium]|nr:phage virion morphogenesis protein [Rhodospirillales bacterium]MDE0382054.1 phage virion morphogenesis protein [Rhodospirillales bacterium]
MAGQGGSVVVDIAVRDGTLARLATVLSHPGDVMDRIGRYMVAATHRRFENERAPDGTPWLKSARAIAEGNRTLTDTGRLRGSITHTLTDGGRGVEVGTDVLYAAIHQFGGRAGRKRRAKIPARPYLGVDERDSAAILRIVARAIERAGT